MTSAFTKAHARLSIRKLEFARNVRKATILTGILETHITLMRIKAITSTISTISAHLVIWKIANLAHHRKSD